MALPTDTLALFPLYPVAPDGRCTCKNATTCDRVGKHPMYAWSRLAAAEKVHGPAGCGYGIATGMRSGIVVVDVDVKDGVDGRAAVSHLPPTYTVRTPTGGYHYYYAYPGWRVRTSAGEFAPGVDIRGDGGYVVAPGSKHANSGFYTVCSDVEISEFPEALEAWDGIVAREASSLVESPLARGQDHTDWNFRWNEAIRHCQACVATAPGDGGAALFVVAQVLVRTYELPLDAAMALLVQVWNPRVLDADGNPYPWDEDDFVRKLEQARDVGTFRVGCAPEGMQDLGAVFAEVRLEQKVSIAAPRKVKAEGHTYKCKPGDVPNGERSKASLGDVIRVLSTHPDWAGTFQYDEFADRIIAVDPPIALLAEGPKGLQDVDVINVRLELEVMHDMLVGKDQAWDAVVSAAGQHTFHPVQDYLRSLPVGDPRMFDGLAARLFGAIAPIEEVFLRKFMVAAVRRAFKPGTKVDSALVLYEEAGGKQKTTFIKELFGFDWVASLSHNTPEVGRKLQGNWCLDMGEMGAVTKGELEDINEFMTACDDHYRAPYSRTFQRRARGAVLTGTTNNPSFMRTSAHARRFWPIEIRKMIDMTYLRANRDAMWAAAVALAFASPMSDWLFDGAHWLDGTELAAGVVVGLEYQDRDAWHESIEQYLYGRTLTTPTEIYTCLFAGAQGEGGYDNRKRDRIVRVLRHIGCVSRATRIEGRVIKRWHVPEELAMLQLAMRLGEPSLPDPRPS